METQGGASGLAENICVGGGFQSAVSGSATSVLLVRNEDSQAPPRPMAQTLGLAQVGVRGARVTLRPQMVLLVLSASAKP